MGKRVFFPRLIIILAAYIFAGFINTEKTGFETKILTETNKTTKQNTYCSNVSYHDRKNKILFFISFSLSIKKTRSVARQDVPKLTIGFLFRDYPCHDTISPCARSCTSLSSRKTFFFHFVFYKHRCINYYDDVARRKPFTFLFRHSV